MLHPQPLEARLNEPALIAIVDDDAPLRAALVNLVRSLGHDTSDFGSAEDFLARSSTRPVGVLLSDIGLLGMDGVALQAALRSQGALFPIILMTAASDRHVHDAALAGGAIACLRKPFESALLIATLEPAL